ncbi:MAG: hypothetical protein M1828_003260 [Chrysothrix sp. TS-e1954]|nr:MAG: hypothetical protein M1828_003260 [Chrysothrix sp. TS-e1954]
MPATEPSKDLRPNPRNLPSSPSTSSNQNSDSGGGVQLRRSVRRKDRIQTESSGEERNDMASATGIPEQNPARSQQEEEPLLGGPGDAQQPEGKPLYMNLFGGTAIIAQAGIWILTGIVWGSVLSHPLILFSAHPLLNSAGILLTVQAILTLQPTTTAAQKHRGTYLHSALNNVALLLLAAGLVLIEYNKGWNGQHFYSVHGILGIVVYSLFAVQAFVGATQFFLPGMYGGVGKAKALYKYHRVSGYVVSTALLATVCAATTTGFNKASLHMTLWSVVLASAVTVVGVGARVRRSKLGL